MDTGGQGFLYLKNVQKYHVFYYYRYTNWSKNSMNHVAFENKLNEKERRAWICSKSVINNFLGVHQSDNYKEIVKDMIKAFAELKVLMSLKIHMLYNHIDFFPDNLAEESDEHGEKFHQEMSNM